VQVIPAQRLGVEHPAQPQPARKPPPTPPTPPKAEQEPPPRSEAPALPRPAAEKPPKPVKPETAKPEPPDNRVDPTTRQKVVPPPREVLQKKLGAQAPPDAKPGPRGAATGSAAGKVAVGSLTVSPENPDFNYSYYSAQTQSRIEENWTRSPVGSGVHATVSFTIHGDGSISDLKLRESSGFDTFDLAAMRSVQNAAPFAPLPRAFTLNHDSVSVIWIAR
jgi:protein TonB